jgi:hypothetical protein
LLGTPIAKLTHPKYAERQDYKDEFYGLPHYKNL